MKKGLIFLFCALLLAAFAAGGVGFLTWQSVTESTVPNPKLRVMGQEFDFASSTWHSPVFGGLLYKDFAVARDVANTSIGEMQPGTLITVAPPPGYETSLSLFFGEKEVYTATINQQTALASQHTMQVGTYHIKATSHLAKEQGKAYGQFGFYLSFTVNAKKQPEPEAPPQPTQPALVAGNTALAQGDVLSFKLLALPMGVVPTVKTPLGMAVCTPLGTEGDWFCAVPIGNTRAVGEYDVQISVSENLFWNIPVTVKKFEFVEQELTIDVTNPVISEANSPAAYQQYRDKIPPLFETFDEEKYWDGVFIPPAQGRISTDFGTIRYTNGNYEKPSIHWGMDIANAEGTPVIAPGAGRVILAEKLLNTGNTLVIEHGGGLKSYYFHMASLTVLEGEMLRQGQEVGTIGTTGYSTGPHLHFEMRIGKEAINPQLLFLEDAGLYSSFAQEQ